MTSVARCEPCKFTFMGRTAADLPEQCPTCGRPFQGVREAKEREASYLRHRSQFVDYDQQMREWAAANGVKPLDPQRVAEDAKAQFSTPGGTSRDEFYASWSAYDAACENFPPRQQQLQRRAEVLELERMLRL